MKQPFVTAIMPTQGRRDMAIQALDRFRCQSYRNRELVIVDNAADPSFPQGVKSSPGIAVTYVTHSLPMTIGAKRNKACRLACGDIIIHWDSDDLSASNRIEHQVHGLVESGTEMAGYNLVPFFRTDDDAWFVYRGAPGAIVGTSLCYWKKTWKARPFPDVQLQEDSQFQIDRDAYSCGSGGRVIARVHRDKTSLEVYDLMDGHRDWQPVSSMAEAIALSE